MKLVAGAGGKDGELPAAESCAMDEGEEDEFDAVRFNESKGKRFFNRIKSLGKKVCITDIELTLINIR